MRFRSAKRKAVHPMSWLPQKPADPGLEALPEEERQQIVAGLKRRWVQLCKELQEHVSGPMQSKGAWLHAQELEAQVVQVEKDVAALSSSKVLVRDEQQ